MGTISPTSAFVAWRTPVLGPIDQSSGSQRAVSDYVTRLIENAATPSRLTFVAEPRRRDAMSLRMELHQNDTTHGGGSERLTLNRVGTPAYGPGDDFWFGISVMLDPTYPPDVAGCWALLYQFFGMTGGTSTGSPPFALEIGSNGFFQMSVRGGVKATPATTAPRGTFQNIAPATKGVWHDFLFHIHLSTGSDGRVDCFYKLASNPAWPATPTVSDTGVNVLTVAGVVQLVFNSMNLYRKSRPEIAVVYFGLAVVQPSRSLVEGYFNTPTPTPTPTPEDDMFTDADRSMLQTTYKLLQEQQVRNAPVVATAVAGLPAATAVAVVAALPASVAVDVAAIAKAVNDDAAKRPLTIVLAPPA